MKTGYGPRQTRVWRNLARSMKVAAGGRCSHCHRVVGVENLELDHVTSLVRGGPAIPPPTGVQALCRPCHRAKSLRAGDVPQTTGTRDRRFTR